MNEFSELLIKIMDHHQLTQQQLAKRVNLTQSAISKYLNSQSPSYDIAIRILNEFGYEIKYDRLGISDINTPYESDQKDALLQSYKKLKQRIKDELGPEYL